MPIVLVLLYCWLNQMAYKFIPTRYVDNNSKLLARIYLNRQNSRRVVLRGYYDFDKEKFYISSISKKANTRSVMKFLLKTIECSRFHWEYSGNYDDKLYQEWLKEHAVFNRLSNYRMTGINLTGLDMKKFVGTGYNPSQDIINTNGRDDGRTKNGETEGFTNPKKQKVEEPKERPEVYY